ncbi:MAG: glycosyltransferase family 2 protein [Verrucomicrobiaceae bacterium]|nr:glycosyltransferase family 2 protein [Verrucomicrobiaceae bacterium]
MSVPPTLFTVVIPARNEAGCVVQTVKETVATLNAANVPHEIVVVDDGSTDGTGDLLRAAMPEVPTLRVVTNNGLHGIGRAIVFGLDHMTGDAAAIVMADASDSPQDLVQYWKLLCAGHECVFGSRFMKGGSVHDYPVVKLVLNRMANTFIRLIFGIRLNDTTNAFKAYRKEVIDGCRPLIAPHFNLLVELPLKAIVRGYTWTMTPISWKNRTTGIAKLKIREMGSRYLFIILYVWLEKFFSRGDYLRKQGN